MLHVKPQGVILAHENSRRLCIRKLLAFKHNRHAFDKPRVRLRKHNYCFPLVCMTSLLVSSAQAHTTHDGVQPKAEFDTDSIDFGIDNRCTACISNVREHFVGDLIKSNKVIKGYGGARLHNVWQGTMRVPIEDDNGKVETFLIPNSYYHPNGDSRLLSPQHWAQQMKPSQRPLQGVAPSQTFHNKVVLTWNKGNSIKTIPLDPWNVATFSIASGFNRFSLYCQEAHIDVDQDDLHPAVLAQAATLIEDEPEDEQVEPDFNVQSPKSTSFDLDGPTPNSNIPHVIEDEEDRQVNNVTAEFLKYHHKFNHCSPKCMQLLARSGVIPCRLARCPVPVCSACLYGKATRCPWRTQQSNTPSDGYVPTTPGEVVSVDQLESNVAGLVAQMAGHPTHSRYKVVTVFVDHATGFSFVHFQKTTDAEETIEGKELFERYAASMGHQIKHYHADNGVFASKAWRAHCIVKHQGLSFAGVGAHHQNGVAENKIRLLQSQARTMLIHAAKRWPKAVTANLWPYAIRMANESSNELPSLAFKDGRTPLQAFAGSRATTNPRFWQPFACPVYVLTPALQSAGGILGKWKDRARVGLYLGRSPNHARSVALVLNLTTGLVSPQFHVTFNPSFQTVKRTFDGLPLEVKWLQAVGFKAKPKTRSTTQREQENRTFDATNPPVNDLQFSTIDDSAWQDLSPIQQDNHQQPDPLPQASEGAQGWFDVEEAPTDDGAQHSDGKESGQSMATDHSTTTLRCSNHIW